MSDAPEAGGLPVPTCRLANCLGNVIVRRRGRFRYLPKCGANSESVLALAEVTWVLSAVYDLDSSAIATAIEMLLNHEPLALEELEVVAKALESFRKRPAVGFSNCLILEVARKAGHLPLGTFDRNLGKLNGVERLPSIP